ncbi:hypothetical protein C8J57DRAFT_1220556 [Mycena rebaudengoi]|nr:hypothetical protein C8J57DRAFT_1220556 [Mycena rebaudengoi]
MIPQLLVIPVLLFVVGLLDNILSDVLQLAERPTPVMATTSLSFFFIASVIAFLAYSLFDGSIRPHSSPFQSTLASIISRRIIPMLLSWISWLRAQIKGLCLPLHTSDPSLSSPRVLPLPHHALVVKRYHGTVQAIHDDDALDKASAALSSVLGPQRHILNPLDEEQIAILVHLLSPEASIRANRTAAAAIAGWQAPHHDPRNYYTNYIPHKVLIALAHAAQRSVGTMAKFVVRPSDPGPEHSLPIQILGSKYVSLEHESDSKYELSVLQALCGLSVDAFVTRWIITEILMEAKTAQAVIRDAFEVLDILCNNSVQGLVMVSAIAGAARDGLSDHELLRDLCATCILNIMQDANYLHQQAPGHSPITGLGVPRYSDCLRIDPH